MIYSNDMFEFLAFLVGVMIMGPIVYIYFLVQDLKKRVDKLEDKNGFDEATKHSKFFRSGTSNQWKDILSNSQTKLIEKNLKSLMKYFNYI